MMEIREEEFDRAVRGLTRAMDEGFSGIHKRLDKVNGRLDRHDDELQDLQVERAFQKGVTQAMGDDAKPALTRREANILKGLLLAALTAAPIVAWWFTNK